MACFLVSTAEAAIVHAIRKSEEKKEAQIEASESKEIAEVKIPMSTKLKWLTWMLLGGSVLLLFEHIWHGEIVPWFPFLTAMENTADALAMLREMATVGVCMALLITAVWLVMCKVADYMVRRSASDVTDEAA